MEASRLAAAASAAPGTSREERAERGWQVQLARLEAYKRRHGDCNVPRGWAEDPPLGSWVKKQRWGKKLLDRGESSTSGMTTMRAAKLDALGFAWDASHLQSGGQAWEAQLTKLAAYKSEHGDCVVPKRWAEDPKLGRWVKDQRSHKTLLDRGEPSRGLTAERAARLEALGFAWAVESEAKAAAEAEAEALAPGAAVAGRPAGRPGGREHRAPTRSDKSKLHSPQNRTARQLKQTTHFDPEHEASRPQLASAQNRWVQCDHTVCGKWRKLKQAQSVDLQMKERLGGETKWYCEMNLDLNYNSCALPEDPAAWSLEPPGEKVPYYMCSLIQPPYNSPYK